MSSDRPGVSHRTLDARHGVSFKKSFNVSALRLFSDRQKLGAARSPDAAHGRQIPAGKSRPDVARVKFQQRAQRFRLQMRLVAEDNRPDGEISLFQPVQFAAQTIELNMPRSGCGFSMRSCAGKFRRSNSGAQAARRSAGGRRRFAPRPALPLPDEMADDGSVAPRQQQFWPAHARRSARAKNDDAEGRDFSHGAHWEFLVPRLFR